VNRLLTFILFFGFIICLVSANTNMVHAYTAIPMDGFSDGVNHYRNGSGTSDYARYEPAQIVEIANNILLYQRTNGGWSANWDPLRILSEEEITAVQAERDKKDTTFDNHATYTQVRYLAHTYRQTDDLAYRKAALAGIVFILQAQCECGGWPHSYPSQENYRPLITFMDDVTTGVLSFLRETLQDTETYAFLREKNCLDILGPGSSVIFEEPHGDLYSTIAESVRKGDACILRLQVVVNGKRTVWAGQYDRTTLKPTQARTFELPSLVSAESVSVVCYLMEIEKPSPEIRDAIVAAIEWFEKSKISGIRVETFDIDPIRYDNHTATFDRRVVEDADAPTIWARFYEIDTNRPFMANRDGIAVYSLAEVAHERRTGYAWYTYAPASLLEKEYPAWRQKWEATPSP